MKVLIIEDEREIALNLVEDLRILRPQIEIVGTVSSIDCAVRLINKEPKLDIIFADIKIDDGMSFYVFDQVNTNAKVVFTTAYDEFAVKAFDYNCADYLLKPVSIKALERALERCESFGQSISSDSMHCLSSSIISGKVGFRNKILLEKGTDILIRDVEDMCYVQTERGYVTAFFKDGFKSMINSSLTTLSESLDPAKFMRINRQVVVNLDFIERISHGDGREYVLKLKQPYAKDSFVISADTKHRILQHLC